MEGVVPRAGTTASTKMACFPANLRCDFWRYPHPYPQSGGVARVSRHADVRGLEGDGYRRRYHSLGTGPASTTTTERHALKNANTAPTSQPVNPAVLLRLAAHLEAAEAEASPASPEVVADRLVILLRDFGRVSALLSVAEAALPAECAAGDADVRGTIEVAQRMLHDAVASLERLHD